LYIDVGEERCFGRYDWQVVLKVFFCDNPPLMSDDIERRRSLMKIDCPHCGIAGSVDDSYIGLNVTCPGCRGIFEVRAKQKQDAVAGSSLDIMVKISCPHCGVKGATAEDHLHRKVICPECREIFEVTLGPEEEQAYLQSLADKQELLILSDALDKVFQEPSEAELELYRGFGIIDEEPPAAGKSEPQTDVPAESGFIEAEDASDDIGDQVLSAEVEPARGDLAELTALESEEGNSEEVEREPYGVDREQCWQCGKDGTGEPFTAKEGRLYCPDCLPEHQSSANDLLEKEPEAGVEIVARDVVEEKKPAKRGLWQKMTSWVKPATGKKN
jgi:phage FluMu protein Com